MTKRTILIPALLIASLAVAACNTVRGAGEDARSVGRVFSSNPDGNK